MLEPDPGHVEHEISEPRLYRSGEHAGLCREDGLIQRRLAVDVRLQFPHQAVPAVYGLPDRQMRDHAREEALTGCDFGLDLGSRRLGCGTGDLQVTLGRHQILKSIRVVVADYGCLSDRSNATVERLADRLGGELGPRFKREVRDSPPRQKAPELRVAGEVLAPVAINAGSHLAVAYAYAQFASATDQPIV